jgi:hypothetical protein
MDMKNMLAIAERSDAVCKEDLLDGGRRLLISIPE